MLRVLDQNPIAEGDPIPFMWLAKGRAKELGLTGLEVVYEGVRFRVTYWTLNDKRATGKLDVPMVLRRERMYIGYDGTMTAPQILEKKTLPVDTANGLVILWRSHGP